MTASVHHERTRRAGGAPFVGFITKGCLSPPCSAPARALLPQFSASDYPARTVILSARARPQDPSVSGAGSLVYRRAPQPCRGLLRHACGDSSLAEFARRYTSRMSLPTGLPAPNLP